MKKVALIPVAIMLLSALFPAVALGKGASKAEITGPGLDNPIFLAGEGQASGKRLMHIAEAAGFFPATFGQSPDPMLDSRPAGDLGPRYRITYLMPGPNNELDEIRQDVYPYAEPTPVSYTPPGQPFFGSEQTRGGWYVASTSFLKDALIQAGLPETQAALPETQAGLPEGVPTRADSGTFTWMVVGLLAALGGMLLFWSGPSLYAPPPPTRGEVAHPLLSHHRRPPPHGGRRDHGHVGSIRDRREGGRLTVPPTLDDRWTVRVPQS